MTIKNGYRTDLVISFFVGGIIGIGFAFLLTSNNTKKIDRSMKKLYNQGKKGGKRITHSILERGSEWLDDFEVNHVNEEDKGGGDIGYVIHEMIEEDDVSLDQSPSIK